MGWLQAVRQAELLSGGLLHEYRRSNGQPFRTPAGQEPPTQTPNHTYTRAMVWNPANNTYVRWDVQGYNIFCAGYIQRWTAS
jgi:hypothetical protein